MVVERCWVARWMAAWFRVPVEVPVGGKQGGKGGREGGKEGRRGGGGVNEWWLEEIVKDSHAGSCSLLLYVQQMRMGIVVDSKEKGGWNGTRLIRETTRAIFPSPSLVLPIDQPHTHVPVTIIAPELCTGNSLRVA